MSTAKPTVSMKTQRRRKKSSSSDTTTEVSNQFHDSDMVKFERKRFRNKIKKHVKYTKSVNLLKHSEFNLKQRKSIMMSEDLNTQENHDLLLRKEITTGKGLGVPLCEGEEIVTVQ